MTARQLAPEAAGLAFAAMGRLRDLDAGTLARLLDRASDARPGLASDVAAIISDVRARGDAALLHMARRFDGAHLDRVEVTHDALDAARRALEPDSRRALEQAAAAIRRFHEAQRPGTLDLETFPGVRLTRIVEPVGRVGVYAPGGRASYPSSVLMGVVPSRVAGVAETIVCTPPGPDGLPSTAVLAACAIAEADRVFAVGGAGAIAAMAFGTASIPRVDRVVGPGNAWVAEAKRQLNGAIGIDSPAGPSELLIIADGTASPARVSLEMIAQAEHDPDAAAVLVATDPVLVARVIPVLVAMVRDAPRREIIRASLAARGGLVVADDLPEALAFATTYAPEHLLLLTRAPREAALRVRGAGTVFLGENTSVAFGDYLTGANHVLPTGGTSRFFSGLATTDFLRSVTLQEVTPEAARRLAAPVAALAALEGLPGHAAAALDCAAVEERDTLNPPPRLRSAYRDIEPYDPGRAPVPIDLSDNTNLFGPCEVLTGALASIDAGTISRYPAVYADPLKRTLAGLFDVGPGNIATGCGSDDVLDSAMRAFCEPGDRIAYPDPTFGMVPAFARMNAVTAVPVPLLPGLALDVDALLRERPALCYVCRPNNPTGHVFARGDMLRLVDGAAGVVVIDEAYADFAGDDLVREAVASERAVVLRTFSKAWGLAGLRVGAAIGPERLIREIEKSRGPYKVNAVAEHAALALIRSGRDWVREGIERVIRNRSFLSDALRRLGFDVLPSEANFVFARFPAAAGMAPDVARELRLRGVGVRLFVDLPGIGDGLRITIGPPPMLATLLDALERILDERGRDP